MATKNAFLFIFIVIIIDATGLGIIIPSLPSLVAETANVSLEESTSYYGLILGAYALMQFIFSPIVGGLSDRYGRRPVLLLAMFGLGLDYLFMYFAPSLFWIVIGRCLSGALGASYTTATAYIADISSAENKARNFGMVGAAFGIGFVIGPAIGGLLGDLDIRAPFLVAAILSFMNLVYGYFVLNESLAPENRRPFSLLRSNVAGAFVQMFSYKSLAWLFVVMFLYYLAGMAIQTSWVYYTQEKFEWSKFDVGVSLALVGVCIAAIQGGLSGFFAKRFGEVRAAYFSLVIFAVTVISIGLATEGWMLYALMLPYAFTGLAGPAIQTIMSNSTADNAQGELQGSLTSIMSIAEIIGPLLMMQVYASTTLGFAPEDKIYGSPYFLGGGIVLLAILFFGLALRKVKNAKGRQRTS